MNEEQVDRIAGRVKRKFVGTRNAWHGKTLFHWAAQLLVVGCDLVDGDNFNPRQYPPRLQRRSYPELKVIELSKP